MKYAATKLTYFIITVCGFIKKKHTHILYIDYILKSVCLKYKIAQFRLAIVKVIAL